LALRDFLFSEYALRCLRQRSNGFLAFNDYRRPRRVVYEFGGFRLEPQRRVLAHADGRRVELAAKAFDVLAYLVERAGTAVTRDELMNALWPRAVVEDNSLNKLIAAVRKALGEGNYIATLQGRGYQFVAEVRVRRDALEAPLAPANHAAQESRAAPDGSVAAPAEPRRPAVFYGLVAAAAAAAAAVLATAFVADDLDESSPPLTAARLGPVIRTTQLTSFPGDEYSPTLSPDGTRVAFSWNGQDDNRDIYVTMIDGTGLQRLTQAPELDSDPAWSPDGRHIAFLRRVTAVQRDVLVIPALGGTEQRVHSIYLRTIPDVNLAAPKLAWTGDGERLVFASGREGREGTHIYAFSRTSGQLMQLTRGERVYDNSPAISSDGAWLAFRRDPSNPTTVGALMVQELGPGLSPIGEPTGVPTTPARFHSPTWSDGSRYLTYVAGPDIFEWERGAPAPRLVDNTSGVLGGSAIATAEVSVLALARGTPSTVGVASRIGAGPDIWAIRLDPRTRTAIAEPKLHLYSSAGEVQPRFSPDGRRIVFVSTRGGSMQLWVAAADGSSVRQLTDLQADAVTFPSWSRDGERIVFYTSVNGEFQIYTVDADGGPPQHVVEGGGPTWSADGEHLYVTEFADAFTVTRVRIADRQREPLFRGHIAVESADARHLFYWHGQDTHVYMRSLEGDVAQNPEQRLVDTVVGGIAPVDGGFFYVAVTAESVPRAFAFYDYATGASHDVAPAPALTMGVGGLTVSADGSQLLYTAQQSPSGADLVLLNFAPVRSQ
jgi:Tol biopolymer transport system component/DNA-binding winged helix-turn-helix (wHTH) protein